MLFPKMPVDTTNMTPDEGVLLCAPDHFRVAYAINPHMRAADGGINVVDPLVAREQWRALKDAYAGLGVATHVLDPDPDLPDMVFCANQSFPWRDDSGRLRVLLSSMASAERRPEVAHFERWYRAGGYEIHRLPESAGVLEGMGDLLPHPGRRAILGGWGFRTSEAALAEVAAMMDRPVVPLRLVDPRWYHLDTCLAPLDASTALWCPDAFDAEARAAIEDMFDDLLEPPGDEGAVGFACNLHVVRGRALIDAAAPRTAELLRSRGFDPIPLAMSEFRKSGGSVFCLKMELPGRGA